MNRNSNREGRVPPHNLAAEESTLGALLLSRDAQADVLPHLSPGDFYKPAHQIVFDTMRLMARLDKPIDAVTLAEELRISGQDEMVGGIEFLSSLMNSTPAISNAMRYAETVLQTSQQRAIIALAAEMADAAYNEQPLNETVMEAKARLDLVELMGGTKVTTVRGEDFMAQPPAPYNWVMPYIIEDDDRMLLTGGEGAKKSLTLLQWAVMTACGVHWWTMTSVKPKRVCFVDLELGLKRTRRRAELNKLEADFACPGWEQNLVIRSGSEDIDLSTRAGASWLASIVEQAEPDLLIIGPIYRLTSGIAKPGDIGGEDAAKRAAFALDKIRERFGCALLAETHAAKGDAGRGRDMRPFGSSVWTRWPEFGYALTRQSPDAGGYSEDNRDWVHWRGDRDPREWPDFFRWENSGWRMRADFSISGTPSWYSDLVNGGKPAQGRRPGALPSALPLADPDDF